MLSTKMKQVQRKRPPLAYLLGKGASLGIVVYRGVEGSTGANFLRFNSWQNGHD